MPREANRNLLQYYRLDDMIFEENSQGDEMFVVQAGEVKLFTEKSGQKVELTTLGPGNFFGEMSLIDAAPRSATAVASQENTCLAVLDQTKFLYLVSQQPGFALTIMYTMSKRLRNLLKETQNQISVE